MYRIVLQGKKGIFVTFLHIDGKQNDEFNEVAGAADYHSHGIGEQVYLSKGRHVAKVIYRTYIPNGGSVTTQNSNWDWPIAFLKVRYYKLGKPLPSLPSHQPKTTKIYAQDNYQFYPNNKWFQLSNLLLFITLEKAQIVQLKYHIVTKTVSSCQISTRILIDQNVNKDFMGISGNNEMQQISVSGKVRLEKGAHLFVLQYKTTAARELKNAQDQQVAYLSVTYNDK